MKLPKFDTIISKKVVHPINVKIDWLPDPKRKRHPIGVIIDKLTRSIENTVTGEVFNTEIFRLKVKDGKFIKKKDWQFDWHKELRDEVRKVYKLSITKNPDIIQGMISIEDKGDHIFIHLLESANFNRGKKKVYTGVPANLVAYACKVSFEKGYSGFVAFDSKTVLVKHYEKILGAIHFHGLRMYIDTNGAQKLLEQYFRK